MYIYIYMCVCEGDTCYWITASDSKEKTLAEESSELRMAGMRRASAVRYERITSARSAFPRSSVPGFLIMTSRASELPT